MSLTKEAIQHIQDCATLERVNIEVAAAETQVPLAAVPESIRLSSLENYMPNAARFRMGYRTTHINDFIDYLKHYDTQGATCFISPNTMSAKTIIDLGTLHEPGHKEHSAELKLKRSAAFDALLNAATERRGLSQKAAGEFIEDFSEHLRIFSKEGDTMTPAEASRSLQDLTIERARNVNSKVDDFAASMNAMDSIEAKNQHLLPAEILFKCIPYSGLEERQFKLRVSILTGDDKPRISLRIIKFETIEEEMAEEFRDKIVGETEGLHVKTYIGSED